MNRYIKNIGRLLLGLALSFATYSCNDYLEEENYTNLTGEDFISEDNADRLVVGIYDALRPVYKGYDVAMLGTDIFTTQGNISTDLSSLNVYFNLNSSNGSFSSEWGRNYSVISKANIVVNRFTNEISWVDSNLSARDNGIAQAKGLRALAYFNLVQQFGGVVISLEEITEISSDYTRSTEEETYTQIITDLEEAIPDLEAYPETGRFSKRAAQHLLAKVYLTRAYTSFAGSDDFEKAAALAESAIDGYDIKSQTYAQVFDYDNQVNDEVLFAIQYGAGGDYEDRNNNKHSILMYSVDQLPGMNRQNPYGFRDGNAMPTEFFYSLFDDNDTREEATIHRTLFANVVDSVGTDIIAVGDTVAYFPKNALTADQLADKLDRYYVYQPDQYYYNDAPVDVPGVNYLYTANTNTTNFPIFKKFDDVGFDEAEGGYRDTFVFRVAESHLIAAEAYLGAGNPAMAISHMNIVRERATGVANHYAAVTIDDILDERALELAGETNRWNDLKRTGKLEERMKLYNPHVIDHGSFDPSVHLLRPIPASEIILSDNNIEQNPGY
ncbi:RagB/SusD family nutrient uptake outer membrane protein [Zobellia galactanivorans]|uniref:RagB/SusD family nutrient uptake outer membrane protein n=1 Tax=Zobellia galactanivorans (strain DSM 12802 / CCUG 47099 / CIP 106680 / NCIMB 13871 / Dsij) TaxID=63186 RepID=UPI0026E45115|nr:RagB/SusD family nutrient uptake outer membrane protein [Zobellia galactanivorans]MDO6808170.1 RagB/SusD family nutrient uptake outer membrane protein [Zobellia galactanivorans]